MSKTKLVGILNITPDSFSDGNLYNQQTSCAEQLKQLIALGADVIDIGAISTRPQANLATFEEEIRRYAEILPAIIPILENSKVKVSIDSFNFETVKYLNEQIKIDWVNDQSGFTDIRAIQLLKDTEIKLVIMHHTSIPVDPKNIVDTDLDIVQVVTNWLLKKADYLVSQGIKKSQIIIDPGIGFGKNAEQSWQLIKAANSFTTLGYPVLYGHSRKSFLNLITDLEFAKRDLETAIISFYLESQGVDFLRVHDIDSNLRALQVRRKI